MLDWVVFPCEKALGCSDRSERSRWAGNIASRRVCCRFLERWGRTIAIPSIGNQGRFGAEPETGVDPGVGAVIRAVRGDLGDSRLAVCSKRW